MRIILFFTLFTLATCDVDVSCCRPGDGVVLSNMSLCFDVTHNETYKIRLKCEEADVAPSSVFEFKITEGGLMILYHQGMEAQHESDKYCLANDLVENETYIILCHEEETELLDDSILGYCLLVSFVFLLPTAIVYCVLPEMRDTQGKCMISFCASFALGVGILAIMKLVPYSNMNVCAARGFFTYFFLLSSFFWTNAISIQILVNMRRPSTVDYGWKPFIWYALYAWSIPAILTIAMAIVNFHPGTHSKPGIGLNTCWFYTKMHQWYYFYSVMMMLILANICIFVYITLHLWRQSFCSSHMKALRYKFLMTVRLVFIMGLPWLFEMISSVSPPHIIWVITDILNALQGLMIFLLLVVFRRKVIKGLYKRGWLDCMSGVVERHLAVGDDEEDAVQHTTAEVILDDRRIH